MLLPGNCKQPIISTDETKLLSSPPVKQRQNPKPVYLDLSTRHDWPVKNAIFDLPIILKGKLKRTSGNWLSPLGAQNKDIGWAPLNVANQGNYVCDVGCQYSTKNSYSEVSLS